MCLFIQAQLENLSIVAKNFKGKILFMHVNVDVVDKFERFHVQRMLDFFNLKKEDCPTIRYVQPFFNPHSHKVCATNPLPLQK